MQDPPTQSPTGALAPRKDETDHYAMRPGIQNDKFLDANTGLPLDEGLCRIARKKEIDYFKGKGMWEIRSINEARTMMG